MVLVLIDLMTSMRRFADLQHSYTQRRNHPMNSFFVSVLAACMTPKSVQFEGDNWDYVYEWTCDEMGESHKTIQIKAYAEYPLTSTTTIDLFNRYPVSEHVEAKSE